MWGFYESPRLVPLNSVPPQEAMPFPLGRQERYIHGLHCYNACCVGAMVSQHAVAWTDSSREIIRREGAGEGILPTADGESSYGPPRRKQVLQLEGTYNTAQTGPENTDAALMRVHPPRLE